ncbi:hypothetical protein KI387_005541, partial [Taxus chinensis]
MNSIEDLEKIQFSTKRFDEPAFDCWQMVGHEQEEDDAELYSFVLICLGYSKMSILFD